MHGIWSLTLVTLVTLVLLLSLFSRSHYTVVHIVLTNPILFDKAINLKLAKLSKSPTYILPSTTSRLTIKQTEDSIYAHQPPDCAIERINVKSKACNPRYFHNQSHGQHVHLPIPSLNKI